MSVSGLPADADETRRAGGEPATLCVGSIPLVSGDGHAIAGPDRPGRADDCVDTGTGIVAHLPEVKGVWAHEAGGSRMWLTVAIKTMYGGHSKQAGLIASQCHAGAYANRWVIVVDDDIDPANLNDVIWYMCTRCDPKDGVDVLNGWWSTHLDPMSYSLEDPRNSRVVVDACIPFRRKDTFPIVARNSENLDERIFQPFGDVLPRA